ncbi:glutathione-dependent formaldehyde-activating, GFA [Lecanosticta acicola]|uniref:Glutathione-dependent formaldehyde-activating, GFA n=1 Tax=Lecanosticta acicola TaxID=111012 RepID=A0AAI8YZ41_9PEZI|nr:glutathione-dependent formaldehyde-activating, GFA [Lecanosticta acicola]
MSGVNGTEDPHVIDEENVEEWKKRAPYCIHESNDGFKARYEASCHCGKVQYELSREEPLDSKLCHCTTCQTQHAAPFQWAAIFKKDDISFRNGHHNLEWYDPTTKSIEHKLPCKVRCGYCHSPIMDEGRNMVLLFPSLIHFKTEQDKHNFKPRLHMFYNERVMDIPDGLPKWTKLNDGEGSELIEDSPPDMIRELERKRTEEQKKRSSFETEFGSGVNKK